jgi:GT2 family glycosyltransferase
VKGSAEPRVAVLILSYNGRRWLEECVPSVLRLDYSNFEVVVIDNGSSDGTLGYLATEFPQVQIVRLEENVGYARGFNAGLEYAANSGAEYFLTMNNDTVIDRGALRALVDTAKGKERAGFVTGKVYFYDRPEMLQTVGKREDRVLWNGSHIGWNEQDTGQYEEAAERAFVDDVYCLVDRTMYDQLGGYDSDFYLQCEEWDWQVRAKEEGWRIYYTPSAMLWHRVSATIGGLGGATSEYFLYRNRIVVLAKHGGAMRLCRFLVREGMNAVYMFLQALVRLDVDALKPRLARILGLVAGAWWVVGKQQSTGVPPLVQRLSQP